MVQYIIEVIVFQSLFLGAYLLFLRRETFFQPNRIYLLGTAIFSFLLPFFEVEFFKTQVELPVRVYELPAVLIGSPHTVELNGNPEGLSLSLLVLFFYGLGVLYSSWLLFRKYVAMQRFFRFKRKEDHDIVIIPNSDTAFTFMNTVFMGELINAETRKHILAHELVHARQKHGIDLLFFELLRVVFWFNPLIYAYQKTIAELHEFIADAKAVTATESKNYYNGLLNTAFGTANISFINTFFNQSLIKKRILMLHKHSKTTAKWKYLILLPLLLGILTYESCSTDNESGAKEGQTLEQQIQNLQASLDAKDSLTTEERKMLVKLASSNYTKIKNANGTPVITVVGYAADKDKAITDVPFAVIEQVPTYPGCEGLTDNEDKKACMSEHVSAFVQQKFDTSLGKKLGLKGINKVYVQFKIDENGDAQFMRARGPAPELEKEAERIIDLLPHMNPGKQRGQAVGVLYALPIVFKVQE